MIATLLLQEVAVESQNMTIILIAVVAIAAAVVAWMYIQKQRALRVRERFGPEYERAVKAAGAPNKAVDVLEERVRRVEKFKIHPLSPEQAESFSREWHRIQAMFVDDPDGAVRSADGLVTEVMTARGYPIEDFETRAADLSVDHPRVVENYRIARTLAERREHKEAGTEELRQAVVNYRALFEDLLETTDARRAAGEVRAIHKSERRRAS
jgi:hypothetical protein